MRRSLSFTIYPCFIEFLFFRRRAPGLSCHRSKAFSAARSFHEFWIFFGKEPRVGNRLRLTVSWFPFSPSPPPPRFPPRTARSGPATAAGEDHSNLSENGRVEMALQETFWAVRFGVFVDRFGIPW